MVLDYYAALARGLRLRGAPPGRARSRSWSVASRVGVVAGIIPWNVPLFVTMLKLAPALAPAAPLVLKPPPETPLFAYLLAEASRQAGLPEGVVNIVPAGREVGEHLVTHPDIDKVSLHREHRRRPPDRLLCGERLRPCTLELGGKSAAILLDDANLERQHRRAPPASP